VRRPAVGALVRVAIAIGLTGYVLWRSDPAEAGRALAGARWTYIGAAVGLVLADRSLMAFRWLVLLRPLAAARPPFREVLRVFFVSTFVGTFLPASVGGDAVRAWALSRYGVRLSDSVASVLLDRAFGIVSILLVGGAAALVAPPSVPSWLPPATLALALATCVAMAVALFSRTAERVTHAALGRVPWTRAAGAGRGVIAAFHRYRSHPAALLNVLAGSIGVQGLRIAQAWLLGLALGIPLGPALYLVYVPVILLVMQIPITINGLGTSQWAFVSLFGESGVAAADAFALSILFVGLGVVGNLPGGLLYATGGLVGSRAIRETGDGTADPEQGAPGERRISTR
jgi:glycosyltransferase 2 family protein